MFVKANMADLNPIMEMLDLVKQRLTEQHLDIWDDAYPSYEVICQDIESLNAYILKKDAAIVGYIALAEPEQAEGLQDQTVCSFVRVMVHPAYQGKGYGKELVQQIIAVIRARGFQMIEILVSLDNQRATHLYESFGFVFSKQVPFPWGEMLVFRLQLAMVDKLEKAKQLVRFQAEDHCLIGLQKEKTLHKTIKYYICDDVKHHEVPIGKMYADVCLGTQIYEIQTKQFRLLRHKLDVFLKHYQVTIVFPIAYHKQIYVIDEQGEIKSPRKSPKKGSPLAIFSEMYQIKPYLEHPNLSFLVFLFDIDEYRHKAPKRHARSQGYIRKDQVPTKWIAAYPLQTVWDYQKLLAAYPFTEAPFTVADLVKKARISPKQAFCAANVLSHLGVIEQIGKKGNAYIYQIKNQ